MYSPLPTSISPDYARGVDLFSGFRIYLLVFDAVACLFIQLMKADFFAFRCGRVESYRTRNQGKLQIAFPIGSWRHDLNSKRYKGCQTTVISSRRPPPTIGRFPFVPRNISLQRNFLAKASVGCRVHHDFDFPPKSRPRVPLKMVP